MTRGKNIKGIYDRDPIRIPVRLVDGQWEYFYGGGVPVTNGAVGDLIVDRGSIQDKEFLVRICRTSKHKILDKGTQLLVALTIRDISPLSEAERKLFHPTGANAPKLGHAHYFTPRSGYTRFVSIWIDKPTKDQLYVDSNAQGGVWLDVQGLEPKGVTSSSVRLPECISPTPADSLNHAFTLLSERLEPWRKSHTGNIYDRMLYQEVNGKWYPLDILRNAAVATEEHQFIRDQWARISEALVRLN